MKKIIGQHPDIDDILLFGSVARGKKRPNDTDVLVIFKKTVNKKAEHLIRKELEQHYRNVSILSKTKKTVLDQSFDARESILFEGRSIVTGKNLAELYGFDPVGMFKYDFGKWSKLQKTKFYHALNGRAGEQGMLQKLDSMKLSANLIIAPLGMIEPMREFLESWELKHTYIPLLIPQRMNKKRILEG